MKRDSGSGVQSIISSPDISAPRSDGRGLMQTMSSEFVRRTLYPILRWHEYPESYGLLRQFREFEFAPLERVTAYQYGRLFELIKHANEHVPYYRQLFKEQGVIPENLHLPQDFSSIPVLSKNTLRERLSELIADNADRSHLKLNASGGSTGEPVQFYQDNAYWGSARAIRWMFEGWWGIQPGEPTASVWGTDRDLGESHWKERLNYRISQVRICNAFALTEASMDQFAKALQSWKPRLINGYASALEMFSRFLIGRQKWRIRPRAVASSAETLSDQQRAVIEQAFEAPVYNFYGSREVNNLAAECPAHSGLHTNMLTRYVEIVDEQGKAVPPGVPGRVLVTDLANAAMPFIRYENGDIANWAQNACGCGRPFRLFEKVWGRSSDFIITPGGKFVHGEFFTHLFYPLSEVQTFQIKQTSLNEIQVSIVPRPGVDHVEVQKLAQQIRGMMGTEVNCVFRIVRDIERPASGKHRFTISEVRAPWGMAGNCVCMR